MQEKFEFFLIPIYKIQLNQIFFWEMLANVVFLTYLCTKKVKQHKKQQNYGTRHLLPAL